MVSSEMTDRLNLFHLYTGPLLETQFFRRMLIGNRWIELSAHDISAFFEQLSTRKLSHVCKFGVDHNFHVFVVASRLSLEIFFYDAENILDGIKEWSVSWQKYRDNPERPKVPNDTRVAMDFGTIENPYRIASRVFFAVA